MWTKKNNQTGFTLIELLIATTVFSIILLAASATLIQVGRMYYKGVISSKTQGAARNAIDVVSREIQFSKGNFVPAKKAPDTGPEQFVVCIGSTRFTYVKQKQLGGSDESGYSKHVLWQDKITSGGCDDSPPELGSDDPSPATGGTELLEENMRLKDFDITSAGSEGTYNVKISVIYGDDDLIEFDTSGTPIRCKGSTVGGQWCAFSELSTQVYRRVE